MDAGNGLHPFFNSTERGYCNMSTMSSKRPFLLRAIYEWIVENDCTPYVVVNALLENVSVPQEFVKDGQIVLNISPGAITNLEIGNESMLFTARFGGISTDIFVPTRAVMGVYARENGQGIIFEVEELPEPQPPQTNKSSFLKVVK